MRTWIALAIVAGGCASAGMPGAEPGDDTSAPVDAFVADSPPDACGDDDGDTVCNAADKCAGHDDKLDADMDTVADGCDRCAMADDRPDVNMNGTPDCVEIVQRTISLKEVNGNRWRGWQSNSAAAVHDTVNDNTITGFLDGTTYNSYFVFTLSGFTASSIQGVTLEIELEQYTTSDATETFSVWDVTAPAATVETTGIDLNLHNDLQSGTSYGTATVASAQLGTIVVVPLNAQAAMHATQKLGQDFVLGVHLDTAPGWIRFGHTGAAAPPTTIRLVVRYLP